MKRERDEKKTTRSTTATGIEPAPCLLPDSQIVLLRRRCFLFAHYPVHICEGTHKRASSVRSSLCLLFVGIVGALRLAKQMDNMHYSRLYYRTSYCIPGSIYIPQNGKVIVCRSVARLGSSCGTARLSRRTLVRFLANKSGWSTWTLYRYLRRVNRLVQLGCEPSNYERNKELRPIMEYPSFSFHFFPLSFSSLFLGFYFFSF